MDRRLLTINMKRSGCTRKYFFPYITSLFLMLPLWCLFCNGDIQLMKNGVNKMMEGFKTLLKETVNSQKAELERIEVISKLLDEAKSLTNMEQLETFLWDLQEAADKEYENKVLVKFAIPFASEEFKAKIRELRPTIQEMKMAQNKHPSAYQLACGIESLVKKLEIYLDLKYKIFDKDTVKPLEYVILKSQEFHEKQ